MEKWFRDNRDNPYPSEAQKCLLAVNANIKEDQVCLCLYACTQPET